MTEQSKYFSPDELKCKDTNVTKLAPGFLERLDALRTEYGYSMKVNSCCRSAEHNKQVGGSLTSLHVYDQSHYKTGGTCAIDIAMTDSVRRKLLIEIALKRGWTVGIAKNYLHLDLRSIYAGLPQIVYVY